MEENQVDLFEQFESLPTEVKEILSNMEQSYESLETANRKLKKFGYEFDYGLDAEPFGLHKIEKHYKLMESDGGYFVIHTKGLTKQEADKMRDEHAQTFPDNEWWVQEHDEDDDREEEPKRYNNDACDGWEDIYNRY